MILWILFLTILLMLVSLPLLTYIGKTKPANRNNRKIVIGILVLLLWIILPIFIISSCYGYGDNTTMVDSCLINRELLDTIIIISAHLGFIPIIIYLAIIYNILNQIFKEKKSHYFFHNK